MVVERRAPCTRGRPSTPLLSSDQGSRLRRRGCGFSRRMVADLMLLIWKRPDHAFTFLYRDHLIARDAGELVHLPARPLNLDRIRLGRRTKAEGQHQLALRQIT